MKKVSFISVVTLLISFFCLSTVFSGEPFAILHKFTKKDFKRTFGNMGMPIKDAEMAGMWPPVKAGDVPDRDAIAAPPYPGAVIVKVNEPFMRDSQGKKMGLSTIELLSSDPYEKIASFYKEKLKGWNEKKFQYSRYFAQSGEVENGARNMKVPHVGVRSLEGILNHGKYTDLESDAKTIIEVFFKRKK